ncbi:MAG: sigma factor [Brevinema sp.]
MKDYSHLENITEAQLWEEYAKSKDSTVRNYLVEKNVDLVRIVICKMSDLLSSSVAEHDVVNVGICGLVNAIDTYDPDRDNQFHTYAIPHIQKSITKNL